MSRLVPFGDDTHLIIAWPICSIWALGATPAGAGSESKITWGYHKKTTRQNFGTPLKSSPGRMGTSTCWSQAGQASPRPGGCVVCCEISPHLIFFQKCNLLLMKLWIAAIPVVVSYRFQGIFKCFLNGSDLMDSSSWNMAGIIISGTWEIRTFVGHLLLDRRC